MMFSALALQAADNDIFYWMVDDSASVDMGDGTSQSISAFFENYGAAADSSFAARVRVTGGDITEDTFLDLYYYDDTTGDFDTYSGDTGVDFGDTGSGYWGAGVPDGNLSPSGAYSAGTPEYSFTLEIGNVVWDSEENPSWTTVATSDPVNYSSLGDYIGHTFDLNPPDTAIWTPTQFTAIPEPSSGVLALLGMALLGLRRRRMKG